MLLSKRESEIVLIIPYTFRKQSQLNQSEDRISQKGIDLITQSHSPIKKKSDQQILEKM